MPAAILGAALLLGLQAAQAQTTAGGGTAGADLPRGVVSQSGPLVAYRVDGDRINAPLTDSPGDSARGRLIVANHHKGLCLLCHSGPIPEERFQGNLAPNLSCAGSRWSVAQLRLRMVDARRINADTIMPPYYRTTGLSRVTPALRLRPILTAQEIEDVVAYLHALVNPGIGANEDSMTK
ncbi:MAG: hypothetical protein NVSMB6_32290 [Burkholderiaceae bacterium]